MADLSELDARDELYWGIVALGGLRDLLAEASTQKSQYDALSPLGVAELAAMVETRIRAAATTLGHYQP